MKQKILRVNMAKAAIHEEPVTATNAVFYVPEEDLDNVFNW